MISITPIKIKRGESRLHKWPRRRTAGSVPALGSARTLYAAAPEGPRQPGSHARNPGGCAVRALWAPMAEHTGGLLYLWGGQTPVRSLGARCVGRRGLTPAGHSWACLCEQIWRVGEFGPCVSGLLCLSAGTLPGRKFLLTIISARSKKQPTFSSFSLPIPVEKTPPKGEKRERHLIFFKKKNVQF